MTSKELSEHVIEGMLEKKAQDITILNLKNISNTVADYFIICSANSDTQVGAIADSVKKQVFETCNEDPWQVEGKENREWVLLDYVDVVVHVFLKGKRDFYAIEELWGDAEISTVSETSISNA
ncbi:MAG: ribosome silencing factor [Cyclobacteriaceae bacterium]|nr:ribosome silencing factor [Cyclobacteriaceae bacterium]MCH8517594.1 ribosome silencing factor [Cyclobacteriaceae bacterium]